MGRELLDSVAKQLTSRRFIVGVFDDGAAAVASLLRDIPKGAIIGMGGSMTTNALGIADKLHERGQLICATGSFNAETSMAMRRLALNADVFITSANAVTEAGQLINVDGIGNRVAATFFGPDKVYFMVGRNKIVKDEAAANERIKQVATPQNAARLNRKTPCNGGECNDCRSAERLCNITVKLEGVPVGKEIHVLLIDEDLGY